MFLRIRSRIPGWFGNNPNLLATERRFSRVKYALLNKLYAFTGRRRRDLFHEVRRD